MIVLLNDFIMEINLNSLVRSAVVLAVGLPVSLALAGSVNSGTESESRVTQDEEMSALVAEYKLDLFKPCTKFAFSTTDSALETEAKNDINKVLGGDVNHRAVCNWVL